MKWFPSFLSPRDCLDVAAVVCDIKNVARFSLDSEQMNPENLAAFDALGVEAIPQPLFTNLLRNDGDKNEYCSLMDTPINANSKQVMYVVKKGNREFADKLYTLELGDGTALEIGLFLGYPACCCRAYGAIQAGQDWLDSMLANTPKNDKLFAACNRCARLFGDWAVMPDYFPCSFSCRASRELAKQFDTASRSVGLSNYLDEAWHHLSSEIHITPLFVKKYSGAGGVTLERKTTFVTSDVKLRFHR